MPKGKFTDRQSTLMALVLAAATASCGSSGNANWQTSIPGEYLGTAPGFREVIRLKADRSFEHEVTVRGKEAVRETGTWRLDSSGTSILIEGFTSFFDHTAQKLSDHGQQI